jgi:hypothetical protein
MILTDEEIEEMLRDEDFDISAVYELGNGEFDLSSPEMDETIHRAFAEGLKKARRKHKEAGVPMVIWRDGKIAYIQPDEIEIDVRG